MQDSVHLKIGGGDGRSILLGVNLETMPDELQSSFAGFPDCDTELEKFSFHKVRLTGLPIPEKPQSGGSGQIPLDPLEEPAYKPASSCSRSHLL